MPTFVYSSVTAPPPPPLAPAAASTAILLEKTFQGRTRPRRRAGAHNFDQSTRRRRRERTRSRCSALTLHTCPVWRSRGRASPRLLAPRPLVLRPLSAGTQSCCRTAWRWCECGDKVAMAGHVSSMLCCLRRIKTHQKHHTSMQRAPALAPRCACGRPCGEGTR